MMNTTTEMMTGMPSPPLRMMAPRGAPMKKKMRHDKASVNLLMASMLCSRKMRSASFMIMAWNSSSLICDCTLLSAMFTTRCFSFSDKRLKRVSRLSVELAARFSATVESRPESGNSV